GRRGAPRDSGAARTRRVRRGPAPMADMRVVDVVEPNGMLRRAAAAHADPDRQPDADELMTRPPGEPGPDHPATTVLATSEPFTASPLTPAQAAALAGGAALGREFRSSLSLPLVARGRILGVATLISCSDERPIGPAEIELATDLTRRAALAADNARLYGERTRVARALQASLLPRELPDVPGVQVAARYHAAGQGKEVGGDFYDLFDTGDGGWAVVIGDVCGKGPEAAAVTGQARYTVRAAAMRQRRPSRILDTLNEALRFQRDDARFCTVTFVRMKLT